MINDFNGQPVRLPDYRVRKHVVLAYTYPAMDRGSEGGNGMYRLPGAVIPIPPLDDAMFLNRPCFGKKGGLFPVASVCNL
jgi:hypothetical protein